ncbi:uncharacterized protein JCM10292_002319 [Rhodotorula paludigena]|uniref:uncharacterized protein n=1 Tax=Rhodotorula paludigena TaxID=86838 RepID=UPI00316D414A
MQHAPSPLSPAPAPDAALSARTSAHDDKDDDGPPAPHVAGASSDGAAGALSGLDAPHEGAQQQEDAHKALPAAQSGGQGEATQRGAEGGEVLERSGGSVEGDKAVESESVKAGPGQDRADAPTSAEDAVVSGSAQNDDGAATLAADAQGADKPAQPAEGITIVEPKPSNPAQQTSALLAPPVPSSASSAGARSDSPAVSTTSTPPPSAPLAPASPAGAASRSATASPALSASPGPGATSATGAPAQPKKFQSSLAVNKKFLEKAGEKAKPDVKPVATRLATPPVPTPASTSHPRLLTGKLSSGPSISLSTSSSSSNASGVSGSNWGKKPTTPTPSSTTAQPGISVPAPGAPSLSAGAGAAAGPRAKGAVWGAPQAGAAEPERQPGLGSRMGMGMGGALGMRMGRGNMANDFPTAAEAAHAKEERARQLNEQVQAREKAAQARQAAQAAQNAHLLEELDAFRGKHLDPNAAHWDEDEDDFLDTTIEFADGTQYKIEQAASGAATPRDEELREPGPGELALREKPLAPGETVAPVRREERFKDDFDRSWPRRPAGPGDSKNLFNERLGKLEPAAHGKRAPPSAGAEPTSILRSGDRRTSSDLPPHLAMAGSPPRARRPSVTSPRAAHAPLHPEPHHGRRRESFAERAPAWGGMGTRRPSASGGLSGAAMGDRQLPPHLAGSGAARPPPHLAHAPAQQQHPLSPPAARRPSLGAAPAVPPSVTSPPAPAASALAPPPAATGEAAPAPAEAAAAPAAPPPDLEEMHAREMHAAAERAKKRREEEEQKRLEQIERARRKAQELEERMQRAEKEKEEAKAKAAAEAKQKREEELAAKEKARASAAEKAKAFAAEKAAPPAGPADRATSWRTAAKPLPAAPAAQQQPAAATQPTAILPRPPVQTVQGKPAPPTQPSAWRRPVAPAAPQSAPAAAARAPLRQLPPHLAAQAQARPAEPKPDPVTQVKAVEPAAAEPAPVSNASRPPAQPSTPPPAAAANLVSPPTSPSKHGAAAAAKAGHKLPAVSQFDDLMSRIKGVMAHPDEQPKESAASEQPAEAEAPTVKLPPRGPARKVSVRAAPSLQYASQLPVVALPTPTEPRGRGRGRSDAPRAARQAPPPVELREPVLPVHSSRRARSPSPPPAWRQYTVRLAPYPPRRPAPARQLKNFHNPGFPRPLYPFSWSPPLRDVNPRRLNRDEMLLPKRYDKNGAPVYPVALPQRRLVPDVEGEQKAAPAPTVSISRASLVRQPEPPRVSPEPAAQPVQPSAAMPERAAEPVSSFLPFGRGLGRGRAPESGSWRRADEAVPVASRGAVADAAERAGTTLAAEQVQDKLPPGAKEGFYRALEAQEIAAEQARSLRVTGGLGGEPVESTPRKAMAAPGRDANGKSPSSPPFRPQDLTQVAASPSSWGGKSLALSVLDPTAASVWSAVPEPPKDNVLGRPTAAVQAGNSLQGILDDDPSEALPSSLAELKSEDGHSAAEAESKEATVLSGRSKDEAKLRAAAPSFSTFLHESAGAIDPSAAAASAAAQARQAPQPYPGFPAQIPPQSTPSPVSAYSPALNQPYASSPGLYNPMSPFGGRPLSQQQGMYPSYAGQAPSPFANQPIHQAYSPMPGYATASPVPPTHGYPTPYRESSSPALPHGITNPALIANYGYGGSRSYGAVGASGPGPIGRPQQGAQYARPPLMQHSGPASYLGGSAGPGGMPSPASGSYGSPYQQSAQPYRMESPYSLGGSIGAGGAVGHGATAPKDLSSARSPSQPQHSYPGAGSGGGSTTMASPVIMPQQLPPVPVFSPGGGGAQGAMHGHHAPISSPVPNAAGLGGGYGAPNGAYARGAGGPFGVGGGMRPGGGGAPMSAMGRHW